MADALNSRIAVFPGQGSQHAGMAKRLYDDFKVAREVFEEASDGAHLDLKTLCFDGPDSDLAATENTQPCLLAASVAAFRVAQAELGYAPAAVAGHSLGEYSALVAAGALRLGTAAGWVRSRGAAMQVAVPAGQGTMAAVLGMEDAAVEELCRRATEAALGKRQAGAVAPGGALAVTPGGGLTVEAVVEPANFNSPGQVVVAGSSDAVDELMALVKASDVRGAKAVPLKVSAPFHCRLMRPARDRMASLFAAAPATDQPAQLACGYVPNRTARVTREAGVVFELLVEQVDHPVLWKQSVLALLAAGHQGGIEFGPGKVLQGLCKRIVDPTGRSLALVGVSDTDGIRALGASGGTA